MLGSVGPEVHLGVNQALTGTAVVSFPVAARTSLELGGDAALEGGGAVRAGDGWAMLSSGLRFAQQWRGDERWERPGPGTAVDLEGGVGAGTGGTGDFGWFSRPAVGAYVGGGAGAFATSWLGVYGRGRAQLARARGAPRTLWSSLSAGVQVDPVDSFGFHAGVTWGRYVNRLDSNEGVLFELGFRLRLDGQD